MMLGKIFIVSVVFVCTLFANPKEETVELNFVNTPISHLTTLISSITGNNFVSDGEIPGNFTFVSQKAIKKSNLMSVYEMILRTKGYMIVNHEDKGFFMITRNNNAQRENIEFDTDKNNYEIKTEVVNLEYFKPSKIKAIVQPYFTSAGKVVADDSLGFLMITDYFDSIEKIKKIIKKIDKPKGLQLHWVRLENVNIKNVFPQIQNLAKIVSAQYRKPIEVIEDKSSNTVIISCEGDEYIELAKLIRKVDSQSKLNLNSSVINLKNSKAADVVKIIQEMEKTRYAKGDIKDREQISISHDVSLNAIILMGEQKVINNYKAIIERLDEPKKQVYVEAQIIEINEDKAKDLGIKWDSLLGGKFNTNGGWAAGLNLNGAGAAPAITNFLKFGPKVEVFGDNDDVTRVTSYKDPSIPNGLTVGAMINLLQSNGASKILSSPKLLCMDNQESSIYVGQVAPFKTAAAVNTAETTSGASYSYKDVGLTLKIKPQIMADGKVRLDVTNKLEDIIATGEDGTLPTTTKREVTSTSIVNDGNEIVIAGLIKDKIVKNKSQVPFLGDIPFLGALFRNNSTSVSRVNLVVILKPTIVKDVEELPADSLMIQSKLISKKDLLMMQELQKIENEEKNTTQESKDESVEVIEVEKEIEKKENTQEDKNTNQINHENRLKAMGL
ncbi:type II secretion system secretin GspD [Arcobacter sp. 15-2]|uniref:type II secretion system secretin GspD n=1 Tax=Arcobacter sp. 15-2 TaxID=3374109 RepID=UPI00399D19D4